MLLIVDLNNLLRRHFHADRVNAVPRAIRAIREVAEYYGCRVRVAYDYPATLKRAEWMPEYKANREKVEGWPECLQACLDAMPWVAEYSAGWEAEDVMATIVARTEGQCILFSSDKDLNQCLKSGRVTILKEYSYGNCRWFTESDLLKPTKEGSGGWGIRPDQCVDFQCLDGDSADNVTGAQGIGPVLASKYLSEYGTIEEIPASELTEAKREAIEDVLSRLDVLRSIFTLNTNVEIQI